MALLYNAAFSELIGDKHPSALGSPHGKVFWENASTVLPLIQQVLRTGVGFTYTDVLLPMNRRGVLEDCWFTYARSPLRDESGSVVGVLSVVTETTQRVLAERAVSVANQRLAALQRVTQRLAATLTEAEIASVLVGEALPLLKADVAKVACRSGDWVERVSESAQPGAMDAVWRRRITDAVPTCQAIVTGRRVVAASHAERRGTFDADWVEAFSSYGPVVALPLRIDREAIGSLTLAFPAGRALTEDDLALLDTLADQCATALERARLLRAEQAQAAALAGSVRRLQALQAVSAALTAAVRSDEIADAVLRHGIAPMADAGAVAMVAPDGSALRTWVQARPGMAARPSGDLPVSANDPLAAAVRQRALVSDVVGNRTVLAVPARAGSRVVGGLRVEIHPDGHPPQVSPGRQRPDARPSLDELIPFLTTLADLMGQALHRAALVEQSLHIAVVLQRALLPALPDIKDLQIAADYAVCTAGAEVGGDWYEVMHLGDGRAGIVIGDVMGHDIRAAAVMGQLRGAVRCFVDLGLTPSQTLSTLHRQVDQLPDIDLVTCLYAVFDSSTRQLRIANAGHPSPLLVRRDGTVTRVPTPGDPPLGAGHVAYTETVVDVPPGAILALYTDGLVESRRQDVDAGVQRLSDELARARSHPLPQMVNRVAERMTAWHGGEDDAALLLVQTPRQPPSA